MDKATPARGRGRLRAVVAAVVLVAAVLLALLGPLLAPHGTGEVLDMPYAPAGGSTPLGTDHLGADVLSRFLAGGRSLVLLSLAALAAAYVLGASAGMLAALRGGRIDPVVLRAADVLLSLPAFLLLSLTVVALGRGVAGVGAATAVVLLPEIVRVVRATTLQALQHDYVEAAVARGERTAYVLLREVLPNLAPVLAADAAVRFVGAVFVVSTAGFLGYGAQPPAADWGLMVLENRDGLSLQPLAVAVPAVGILVLLLAANLLVDAVFPAARRPRTRRRPVVVAADAVADAPVLRLRGLTVGADGPSGTRSVVESVDLELAPGRVLALVGPSGSGKTTLALAALGELRPGLALRQGEVHLAGLPVLGLTERALRRLRSRHAGYVPQDPRTSLAPTMRVAEHIGEFLRARSVPRAQRPERIRSALRAVRLPCDDAFLRRFPHQLSGGQRQRVALAAALAHRPDLLVLDEPTSALDPATAAALLADIKRLREDGGPAILLVAHDLAQVASAADEVAVLDAGRLVERGPVAEVLARPASATARRLVDAARMTALPGPREVANHADTPALVLRGLEARRGARRVLTAIDLSVDPGGCLSVVGPSGGGKTTLLRCLTGLHPDWSGDLRLAGAEVPHGLRGRSRDRLRMLQLVPQDPHDSLNPRHTVGRIIARPLGQYRPELDAEALRREVHRLLEQVGLAAEHADRRPEHLSGGQRQRVALARALAVEPAVLLCDEVTSALDAPTADTVIALLAGLRRELGVALVVVTHDLTVPARLGGQLAVLADGRIRESGPTDRMLSAPTDPVTAELLAAVPSLPMARPAPAGITKQP
ncbi:ATP-binding cassette domain-containing protein [Streptantibioticus ferralitis]|uniref:ATP-binding cassette domain-containing protein n=1 Tax=Streptantibioticus ferralitis TaxID=236510 RepID=A0ABT5Z103_9ACTN|nr:ATP-binding cassette domain-containing protein [Streptantibioticus ferralitis]MDF2257474.1 ATP-binding cassette domain-containing protein [Streptantibioticus ferralitis]